MVKKKRAKAKLAPVQKVKRQSILEIFLQALTELYPLDKCAPGIVCAWIKDKGKFYASIARYEDYNGQGKQILSHAYGDTPEEAIKALAGNWYNGVTQARLLRDMAKTGIRRHRIIHAGVNPDLMWPE